MPCLTITFDRLLDLPYVIAVNALEPVDNIDIMQALFGQEVFTIDISNKVGVKSEPRFSRKPNGVWVREKGHLYTRISAVLMVTRLSVYNIPNADIRLYLNPWAEKTYTSVLTKLPQAVSVNRELQFIDGIDLGSIFGLDSHWPNS